MQFFYSVIFWIALHDPSVIEAKNKTVISKYEQQILLKTQKKANFMIAIVKSPSSLRLAEDKILKIE